jgi:hypothetical protein
MSRAKEYRANADFSRELAKTARLEDQRLWLQIADHWDYLATEADQCQQRDVG